MRLLTRQPDNSTIKIFFQKYCFILIIFIKINIINSKFYWDQEYLKNNLTFLTNATKTTQLRANSIESFTNFLNRNTKHNILNSTVEFNKSSNLFRQQSNNLSNNVLNNSTKSFIKNFRKNKMNDLRTYDKNDIILNNTLNNILNNIQNNNNSDNFKSNPHSVSINNSVNCYNDTCAAYAVPTIRKTRELMKSLEVDGNMKENFNEYSDVPDILDSTIEFKSVQDIYKDTNDTVDYSTTSSTVLLNCDNSTSSCELDSFNDTYDYDDCDDTLPCNITEDEYMTLLLSRYVYPTPSEWILVASHVAVFLTGLIGNSLVCLAVYTNYSMRTVTNIFIVNLAIADLLVILVCLPPSVVWDITETWFLGESMCKIVVYFQSVSVTVSVLTLTFISVDRWYAICFPLRYHTKIQRAIASVAFIWIAALLSDLPEFLALTLKTMPLRYKSVLFTQCVSTWDDETEKNFYIARLVLLYILPLLLMTVAYYKIVRVLWKSETIPGHRESRNHHQYACAYSRGSQCPQTGNTSTMGQLRARRKAAKMLVSVVIMFAITYFPVHLFNLLRYANILSSNEFISIFSLLSHWLCYANSAMNPIIYNLMSAKFRREFRNAFEKCRCARVRVEDRSLNHSAPGTRIHNISPSSRSNYQLTSVRDISRQNLLNLKTMQTTFIEDCGNGHTATTPMLTNCTNNIEIPVAPKKDSSSL